MSKNKKIYCGVDELKSNQKLGTPKECAELKQVRYYGLKKINKDILEEFKGISVVSAQKEQKLYKMFGRTKAEIQLIKNEISDYKQENNYKKLYKKELKDLEEKLKKKKNELNKIIEKMDKLENEEENKKNYKKDSKKTSKKSSKKSTKKSN
jgi:hypothetical protein